MNREKISRMRDERFKASAGEFSRAGSDFRQAMALLLSSAYHFAKGMRIFLSAIALSLIFFFIAPVQANAALINESFETTAPPYPPTGWSQNTTDQSLTYAKTGTYSVLFNAAADYLITPYLVNPGTMTYWMYRSAGVSSFIIEYSYYAGGPWTGLPGSPTTTDYNATFKQESFDLSNYNGIYIKFRRDTANSYYLDDVVITDFGGDAEYNFRINAGTVTLNNADINVTGSIAIKAGGVLAEGTGSGNEIRLTKKWTNSIPGGFTYGDSTVEFYDTTSSTINGNTGFYNLKCVQASKELYFTGISTQTVNGTLTLTGTNGNEIKLRSTLSGTSYYINNAGNTESVSYIDLQDSNASSNDITADNSINSGGNDNAEGSPCWVFPDPTPPAAISNLTALAGSTNDTVKLQWTAPGDDGAGGGNCSGYLIRYATYPITTATFLDINVSTWTPDPVWTPISAGSEEGTAGNRVITGLKGNVTYYFAIKAYDNASPTANYGYWSATPNIWNAYFVPPNPWNIVISQIGEDFIGSATDYVELYNPTNLPIDLSGCSVQVDNVSAGGSYTTPDVTVNLTGTIPAYGFYLVADADMYYPVPDNTAATFIINDSDIIFLVKNTVAVTAPLTDPDIIDFVGLATIAAGNYEGSGAAPDPGNGYCERLSQSGDTIALLQEGNARALFGNSYDTDDNAADFIRTTTGDHLKSEPQSSASSHEISSAPVITTFSPTTGVAGTEITIFGTHFGKYRVSNSSTSHVYFYNNVEVTTYVIWSDTYVVVQVPAGVSGTQPIWLCTQDDFTRHTGTSSINFEGPSDATDPAPVTNLTASLSNIWTGLVTLSWVAPKEDGESGGAAASYDIRYSTFNDLTPANWWTVATQLSGEPTPSSPGTTDYMSVIGLANGTTYWFRIKSDDEIPNTSDLDTGTTAQILVSHIVIGEIQIGGTTTSDEFVELYNPTTAQINLSSLGLYLHIFNSAGTCQNKTLTYINQTIPASGFFLIVSTRTSGVTYDGSVIEDATYSIASGNAMVADGAVSISTAAETGVGMIDLVGMGTQPDGFETQTSTSPSNNNSIERYALGQRSPLVGGAGEFEGNAFDTNYNSYDFIERTTSDPQNSTKAEPAILSVELSGGEYQFGEIPAGVGQSTTSIVASSITVTNRSNLYSKYKLKLANPAPFTSDPGTPGSNIFVLQTKFNADQPLHDSFTGGDHGLTTSDQTCTGTKFAGDQTGENVPPNSPRTLWFHFKSPTSISSNTEKIIPVTVTVEAQ